MTPKEKKQTAIDWLKKELEDYGSSSHLNLDWTTFDQLCEQAKQIEKEQIINAFGIGCQVESTRLIGYHEMAEQHYNETYNK